MTEDWFHNIDVAVKNGVDQIELDLIGDKEKKVYTEALKEIDHEVIWAMIL